MQDELDAKSTALDCLQILREGKRILTTGQSVNRMLLQELLELIFIVHYMFSARKQHSAWLQAPAYTRTTADASRMRDEGPDERRPSR